MRVVEPGERIAQIVFTKYEQMEIEEVSSLSETDRGSGGFGSTGKF
jgi:dUTP pyrophosphatase